MKAARRRVRKRVLVTAARLREETTYQHHVAFANLSAAKKLPRNPSSAARLGNRQPSSAIGSPTLFLSCRAPAHGTARPARCAYAAALVLARRRQPGRGMPHAPAASSVRCLWVTEAAHCREPHARACEPARSAECPSRTACADIMHCENSHGLQGSVLDYARYGYAGRRRAAVFGISEFGRGWRCLEKAVLPGVPCAVRRACVSSLR